ncbi:DNA/RNA non-specific endonuclease [Hymenobacter yonginensis]|uniref:DNA/RNA non-specific endonuclease n=1 Tax=Hymenobacter yonginensis TaxID=748197 RepID=A0ABY7PV67_9BACT|nr:DNA/RNA non-specific endonuclease [Hymenobacter yonginensis]WBO86811.1 DNA/RNA non-specific endonuclease [Hymenobacter yonginensis]
MPVHLTGRRPRTGLLLALLCLLAPAAWAQTTTESFDSGTKATYPAAPVPLATGTWIFDDALLGTDAQDHRAGAQAARLQQAGTLTMDFFLPDGASTVSVQHAAYGTDATAAFELWYQTQGCDTWVRAGQPVVAFSYVLQTASFPVNVPGGLRFQLRKVTGGSARLNLDNFTVTAFTTTAPPPPVAGDNQHLTMGNPSGATADVSMPFNYLLEKPQYALSYHRDRGTPNWVSWYLAPVWIGSAPRVDLFRADETLPASWYRVQGTSYSRSGFDRGHNTPSADRTSTPEDNSATFLMTNMIPQSPDNNQRTWAALENYARTLVDAGNELYIIMGSYGIGGQGEIRTSTPFIPVSATTIDGGRVTVPNRIWKVIVVLPTGNNDVSRVSAATRIIAIDTPNQNGMTTNWGQYRTSVDAIEAATGLDLLSALPTSVQQVVESTIDNGPTQ